MKAVGIVIALGILMVGLGVAAFVPTSNATITQNADALVSFCSGQGTYAYDSHGNRYLQSCNGTSVVV